MTKSIQFVGMCPFESSVWSFFLRLCALMCFSLCLRNACLMVALRHSLDILVPLLVMNSGEFFVIISGSVFRVPLALNSRYVFSAFMDSSAKNVLYRSPVFTRLPVIIMRDLFGLSKIMLQFSFLRSDTPKPVSSAVRIFAVKLMLFSAKISRMAFLVARLTPLAVDFG